MTSDELLRADVTTCAAGAAAAEDLRLLRCYEPVLRFTKGELFLPMPVEDYLEQCSLWRTGPGAAGPARRRGAALRARRAHADSADPDRRTGAGSFASFRGAGARPQGAPGVAA